MFKEKLNLLKQKNEAEGNDKKKIENLVFFVIVLIITIVVINIIWNGNSNKKSITEQDSNKKLAVNKSENIEQNINSTDLELRLEFILSKIQGVGEVNVFINYSESSELVAMYNESTTVSSTEETDTSGGTRKTEETDTQKDIVYTEEDGNKTPITKKSIEPKIEGAIITAKGANDVNIKTNIIQAVEAVTGLATHKIQVFEMN